MKQLLSALVIIFLSVTTCFAKENLSLIKGTWQRRSPDNIKLFEVREGRLHEIANSKLNENGKFYFAFEPAKENFYVIALNEIRYTDSYVFYFKPGDQLSLTVNDTSYVLTGKNTKENIELARWHDFIYPMESLSYYFAGKNATYINYFPVLKEKENAFQAKNTGNKIFDENFKNFQELDFLRNTVNFLFTPRIQHPKQEDLPAYYQKINVSDITSTSNLLEYPYGISLLNKLRTFYSFQTKENDFDKFLAQIQNPTLKGEAVIEILPRFKTYDDVINADEQYGKYLVTESQKKKMIAKKASLVASAKGKKAIDFKFPDINGKEIALSGLKGKFVYVDVWATWCGPCKQEIPHLKKLEEEYHGKDIVFLSVSTDKQRDHEKWKNFVIQENLGGIQLFGGSKAGDIQRPYQITTIPRFMLFDKEGNIIDINAPRPSDPKTKKLFDMLLEQ